MARFRRTRVASRWRAVFADGRPDEITVTGFPSVHRLELELGEGVESLEDDEATTRVYFAGELVAEVRRFEVVEELPEIRTVAIVGCGAAKLAEPAPARDLYVGGLVAKSIAYAEAIGVDLIRIASARHGAIALDRVIAPYDDTLSSREGWQRRAWGEFVAKQIENAIDPWNEREPAAYGKPRLDLGPVRVVVLAGEVYAAPLREALARRRWEVLEPLSGMQIGQRLSWLKKQIGGTLEGVAA